MPNQTSMLYNGAALESIRHGQAHQKNANEATLQLASGKKQTTASKDSSSQAIVAQLDSGVRVLDQNRVNAKNGASVIQVATSALKNIQDLLSTMSALAAKSQSGDTDLTSKALTNQEYTQLRDQITDIANQTRWNGVSLLGGGAAVTAFGAAAAVAATSVNIIAVANAWDVNATNMAGYISGTFESVTVTPSGANYDVSVVVRDPTGRQQTFTARNHAPAAAGTMKLISTTDSSNTFTLTHDAGSVAAITDSTTMKSTLETALGITAASLNGTLNSASADPTAVQNGLTPNTGIVAGAATKPGEYVISYAANSNKMHLSSSDYAEDITVAAGAQTVTFNNGVQVTTAAGFALNAAINQIAFRVTQPGSASLTFQVGPKTSDTVVGTFNSATGATLGVSTTTVDNSTNATAAATAITTALNAVNTSFAQLGAVQGRLESTIQNLTTTMENFSAAKATYSDTDVADAITRQTISTIASEMANIGIGKALMMNQQMLKLAQQA